MRALGDGGAVAQREGERCTRAGKPQSSCPQAERQLKIRDESRVIGIHAFRSSSGRPAPYDAVTLSEGQQRQRSFSGEAFPRSMRHRSIALDTGHDRRVVIVLLDCAGARVTLGMHRQARRGRDLRGYEGFGASAGGKVPGYFGVSGHIAQCRQAEIVARNPRAAERARLGDVDLLDRCGCQAFPRADALEHQPARMRKRNRAYCLRSAVASAPDERDPQARATQRQRERAPRGARAEDRHIELGFTHRASALRYRQSTSAFRG